MLFRLFPVDRTLYRCIFIQLEDMSLFPLMKKKFVDDYHWIDENEMLDFVAIAQSAPGPIAINGAIVVGYRLAGILGIGITILATVIPPFVIISVISFFYNAFRDNFIVSQMLEGMQAGVGAVIASVTWDMISGIIKDKNTGAVLIMIAAFIADCIFQINVIYIILVCILIGVCRALMAGRRHKS